MSPLLVALPFAAGGLYYFFKNKVDAAENLQVDYKDVQIDSGATAASLFTKLVYKVTLKMTNPDRGKIVVKAINLDVYAGARKVGHVQKLEKFEVPARTSMDVQLKGSINTVGAASFIKDIITGDAQFKIAIDGFIDTDLGRVTFARQEIEI